MLPKSSERVAEVIRIANQIAREYDQEYVGTEHLLLAIQREGTGIGAAVLTLSRVLNTIMDDPTGKIYLFAFFFGLVIASILAIGAKVKWSTVPATTLVVGTVVALIIVTCTSPCTAGYPLRFFQSLSRLTHVLDFYSPKKAGLRALVRAVGVDHAGVDGRGRH